jgi:hypothetical protein
MVDPDPVRLRAEARLLGAWGRLLGLGLPEPEVLGALEEELDAPLSSVAGACRVALASGSGLASALDVDGLSLWAQVLLAAGPRDGAVLILAGDQRALEARGGWRRGWLWRKLALLRRAGASVGDGFGALAREARDHGQIALAEGFYAAARAARSGATFGEALRSAGGLSPSEALALGCEAELGEVLAVLAGLGSVEAKSDDLRQAPARGGREGFVQVAAEHAAPLRRGLDRMLSGIEGALGIERGPSPRAELARRAVEARVRKDEQLAEVEPEPEAPGILVSEEPVKRPAARKTIGASSDSRSVDVRSLEDLEAWAAAMGEALAKQALLDAQPGEAATGRELGADLAALRADLVGLVDTPSRRTQLDDLELRFLAWKEEHGGA